MEDTIMKITMTNEEFVNFANELNKLDGCMKDVTTGNIMKLSAVTDGLQISLNRAGLIYNTKVKCLTSDFGDFLCDGYMLMKYANALINNVMDTTTLEIVNDRLIIDYGKGKIQINSLEGNVYEKNVELSIPLTVIKGKDLVDLISKVESAIDTGTSKAILKSVCVETSDYMKTLTCVGCDGTRLNISKADVEDCKDGSVLLPLTLLKSITKVIDINEFITIYNFNDMVVLKTPNFELKLSTANGQYINYSQLLRMKEEWSVVSKEALIGALNKAMIIANELTYLAVNISNKDGVLNITTQNERADFNESIPYESNGVDFDISINCQYLMNAISKLEKDVEFQVVGNYQVFIRNKNDYDNHYLCLILTIRR